MRGIRIGLAALVLGALFSLCYENSVTTAQSTTGSYTSPVFGYTISWDASWELDEQFSDGTSDSLSLVDGQSFVFFSGRNDGADARAAVESFSGFLRDDDSFANTQPMADCPGGNRVLRSVAACFTFLRLYETGESVPEAALLEAWDLGNGAHLLMVATVPQELFGAYLSRWAAIEIAPPGGAIADTAMLPLEAELEGVRFAFEPGVTERDRADVIEGIRLGQTVIGAYLGREDLADIEVNVLATANADQAFAVASTRGFEIEVYAGGESWQFAPNLIRIETLVHELTHVYQNQLLGPGDTGIPLWFDEGAAEAMGYLALTQLGVLEQDDIYQLTAYLLTRFPVSGGLAQFAPYGSLTTEAYPFSYIAVQYLLGRSGLSVSALGVFYRAVGSGTPVDEAFLSTFGLTLEEYYVYFDTWVPLLQSEVTAPLDFYPMHGRDLAATATWQQIPPVVAPGDQLVAIVLTTPGANCTLDVRLAQLAVERDTFANEDGEAFWLVTIPSDAPPGTATLAATCGGSPATATVAVG